jgi:ribosomal protein S18 acetylase RimI-like enzyme
MEQGEDLLTGLIVRPFQMIDLDAIAEIDRKVLGKERKDYWKNQIERLNSHYPLPCLVAEIEGKVIGVVMGEVSGWEFGIPDTIGWISTIGVDPAYQHRGIAKKLTDDFVRNAKSIGVNVLYTLVNWSEWDLLRFFRAMGFTRGGEMINLEFNIT